MNKSTSSITFGKTKKAVETLLENVNKLSEGEKATIELLLDKETQKHLKASIEDARKGNLVSWEEVKKELA